MKSIRLKHRLIIPIALLGIVALLSNILSVVNIRKVNASAPILLMISWTAKAGCRRSACPPRIYIKWR